MRINPKLYNILFTLGIILLILTIDFKRYLISIVVTWFAYMLIHMIGVAVKEPLIENWRMLRNICFICVIPVLNIFSSIMLLFLIMVTHKPDKVKDMIKDFKN